MKNYQDSAFFKIYFIMQTFYEIASLFNHSCNLLAEGEELITYAEIPSLEIARNIASRSSDDIRKKRSLVFYQGIENRQRLFQGKHDRGEEYVFADGSINEEDQRNIESHLPAHFKFISVKNKVIKEGEIWDLTTHPDIWRLGAREELYVCVNIESLTLEPNAKLIIQGNVCSISIQKIIRSDTKNKSTTSDFDIGILPTIVSVDQKRGDHDGLDGSLGKHGANGENGRNPNVVSSMFGPSITDAHLFEEIQHGTNGTDGENGEPGEPGRVGGMVKLTELFIGSFEGFESNPLIVFSKPGDGGNGGDGANGGNGGNGGDGGNGIDASNGTIICGNGGNGGNGGDGGNGGNGGNGGISSNIFIEIPTQYTNCVLPISMPSLGGKAGTAGIAGKGGNGGEGGLQLNEFHDEINPIAGLDGLNGKNGKNGVVGKSRSGAAIFINGVITNHNAAFDTKSNDDNTDAKEKGHTNIELIKSAAKAFVKWNKIGFSKIDQSVLEKREDACLSCPNLQNAEKLLQKLMGNHLNETKIGFRTGGKVCKMCGCVISRKIALPSESCPDRHPVLNNVTRWNEPFHQFDDQKKYSEVNGF